jgi:ABC-type dipeptide/oligopeptide/nickel transport system permease component
MLAYISRRVLGMLIVLFFVSAITFTLMTLTPGGPWDTASPRPVPKAVLEAIKKKYGGDKDPFTRYVDYMWGAVRGDLGPSFTQTRTVNAIIADGFPISAAIGIAAVILSLGIGIPFGLLAALRHNSILDQLCMFVITIGISVPRFVVALACIILFSVTLHVLPSQFQRENAASWIMPVVLLALGPVALILRLVRAQTLEVLGEDYVRTARAKGLPANAVNFRHVLRNALLPVVTLVGIVAANLITGTFIVESIFAIPGIGRYSVQAVARRDYGLLMGTTLFYTAIIVVANMFVDLAYSFIDPRVART